MDSREAQNAPGTEAAANGHGSEQESAGTSALEKRVEELEAQLKEKEAKYLYLYADFENYKKRAIKERSDAMKFGWENLARELLGVVDNLERALDHMPPSTDKTLSQGIHMVLNQFRAVMEKGGVQPVPAQEKPFDPNLHEAVGQEPSEHPEGTVVREHVKGYTMHGRLLRPARVTVSGGGKAAS
jgi:molecular chaperone GrpE